MLAKYKLGDTVMLSKYLVVNGHYYVTSSLTCRLRGSTNLQWSLLKQSKQNACERDHRFHDLPLMGNYCKKSKDTPRRFCRAQKMQTGKLPLTEKWYI